jgi:hypothetical protein
VKFLTLSGLELLSLGLPTSLSRLLVNCNIIPRTENIKLATSVVNANTTDIDRLCGLVVRVSGYITDMSCVSCEIRTGVIYVM